MRSLVEPFFPDFVKTKKVQENPIGRNSYAMLITVEGGPDPPPLTYPLGYPPGGVDKLAAVALKPLLN